MMTKYTRIAYLLAVLNFISVGIVVYKIKKPEVVKLNNKLPTSTTIEATVTSTAASATVVPTKDNRCIIVVDSVRYDISKFRTLHSGGNIFQCNTDMSNVFHQQHDNGYLQTMSQYKI